MLYLLFSVGVSSLSGRGNNNRALSTWQVGRLKRRRKMHSKE